MNLLNREALLKRDELKIEAVDLGNGDTVYVRQMTGRERDLFERSLMKEVKDKKGKTDFERNLEDFRAKLAVTTLCDANGNMLLRPTDYEALSKNMSAFKLEKIVEVASRVNAITEEDKEVLVKNSSGAQHAGSNSDLPSN